ncbi:hypothetical protein ABZY42_02870 [Streptomyces sp. NPDC006622]|uniref:hypothetical protein n=1 Tax=Streptomyces sp. NPDC006622 TaxID=3155459 RepID=UPI0033B28E8B
MRDARRPRRLTVDETTTYLWTVRHRHRDGQVCEDVLTLIRDGVRTRIVFREGEGRYVGGGAYTHSGGVGDRAHHLNLHEPGTVRALVDEARRRGLLPYDGELDGWILFPAVTRAAAATPGTAADRPASPWGGRPASP